MVGGCWRLEVTFPDGSLWINSLSMFPYTSKEAKSTSLMITGESVRLQTDLEKWQERHKTCMKQKSQRDMRSSLTLSPRKSGNLTHIEPGGAFE